MTGNSLSVGKYELIEVLQVNEGIAVALCRDPQRNIEVICKTASTPLPSDEQIATLKREYELVQKAQGQGVVKLLGMERSESGTPILVFEKFNGTRLDMGENPLEPQEYLPLFILITRALAHVHSKKIIHRDLNPDNILWDRKTRDISIIDFNLASDILTESVKSDAVESLCGTLPFISPEQTGRMNRKVDFRSDYYSLGMTFYHVLAGRSPFQAHDAMGWVYCHITEQPALLSDRHSHVPVAVAKIIDKLLAKNAEDRYQSGYGLIRDLEIVLDGLAGNKLDSFVPGRFDVCEWLTIPEKLYGREIELANFLSFFDRARAGEKLMCIIAGSSGMGKSVLVNEVYKPVIEARGNFIAGKCDQYKRNMPYSAIKPAFADLIRQYLAKPAEEVEFVRRQIAEHIGDSVQVIAEIIPELEAITGTLPQAPKLPPTEARVRFQKAFESLVRIFTAGGKPLVAFLDDLQWSDIPSLKLIEFLMNEADLPSLMVTAVFRDNEVQPGHPLLASLDSIRKSHEIPAIKLSPLTKVSISALLCDTFRCSPADVVDLAEILFNKTAGNPFHITEMIKTLHESGAISFDTNQGRWLWDVQVIAEAGITNDVVELMLATLKKCSDKAQERLKIAACIGAHFDLSVLAAVSESSEYEVLEDLWPTIEKGLIIPLGESYKLLKSGMATGKKQFHFKFQHDRVHEAAYTLIPESQRPLTHLNIGRLLRRKYQGRDLENQIIEVVRHYNFAMNLITDSDEMLQACHLNLMAAIKNRNSVAYDSSVQHLKLAQKYLPGTYWKEHYALTLKVYMNLSEVAFLVGDYQLVESMNSELLLNVKDVLDRAEINIMRIDQKFSQGLSAEARNIGIRSLHELGLKFPVKPNKLTVIKHIIGIKRRLKNVEIEKVVEGKRLNDRQIQLILKQLAVLNPIFFAMADRMASAVSVLENLRLSLEHGICPESAYGFAGVASIFGNMLGNLPMGYRLGKVALDVIDLFNVVSIKPAIYHIFTSFIAPFNVDLEKIPEYVGMTVEAGLAAGDLYFLPVAAALGLGYNFHEPLGETIEKDNNYYLHLTRNSNNQKCYELNQFLNRYRRILFEKPSEAQMDQYREQDRKALQVFDKDQFLIGSFVFQTFSGALHYMFGDYQSAWQSINKVSNYFLAARGTFYETEYHFFHALILSQIWPHLDSAEKREGMKRLKFALQRMKVMSDHHPGNFRHKYLAIQAELFAIKGRIGEAVECGEQALDGMNRNLFRDVGVLSELTAKRLMQLGKKRMAQVYIKDASTAFKAWQAEHKLAQLMDQWPLLKQEFAAPKGMTRGQSQRSVKSSSTNRGMGHQSLDMLTITRASQTLSGQVEMDGLVQHLMKIIMENAGAHYAVLMLKEKGKTHTRVVARSLGNETKMMQNMLLSDCNELSLSIMLYTSRVNETVIVDDVERDERYRTDPYIQKVRPKSILAMPITIKGQAIGYFYLENRMTSGSFTKDRIDILNILGTQAAISLENAQLYTSLEQKVRERTTQLAERSRDIRSILTNIKQGIMTITPNLEVHPEYSQYLESILETKDIASHDFMQLIFADSDVSADIQSQIKVALEFSLQQDALGFESNEGVLIREFVRKKAGREDQHLELDWEPMVDGRNVVEKIMVTLRDVTEMKKLQEASARSRKELMLLSQILNAGSERYQNFMVNAHRLLEKSRDLMSAAQPEDQESINVAYRHLHTVKGNARLLSFTELTSLVHECESILMQLKSQAVPFAKARVSVLDYIQKIMGALEQYQEVFTDKLLAYTSSGQSVRSVRLLGKLARKVKQWEQSHPELGRELKEILDSVDQQSLEELLDPLRANTIELAKEMGKAAPRFQVDGQELPLNETESLLLTNAFVHLLSNAIHHGIETPEQRQQAGKAPEGTISIRAEDQGHHHLFVIYDDGKGLNLEAIRNKAISRQLISSKDKLTDHELAMMIFKSGFSTAESVSQSAGRGVGMDAIQDMVHEAGGVLELVLDQHSPSTTKAFRIQFTLPTLRNARRVEAA